MDLKRGVGTHDSRFCGLERCGGKARGEDFLDSLRLLRRFEQVGLPLGKNHPDLVGVFFGDELVKACLNLQQRGIERALGAVMRVEVESGGGGQRRAGCGESRVGECGGP